MAKILLVSTKKRLTLAEALVAPITTSILFPAVGKKLLMADDFPQNMAENYTNQLQNSLNNITNLSS